MVRRRHFQGSASQGSLHATLLYPCIHQEGRIVKTSSPGLCIHVETSEERLQESIEGKRMFMLNNCSKINLSPYIAVIEIVILSVYDVES